MVLHWRYTVMHGLHSRRDSTRQDKNESVKVHSSRLPHSRSVLVSSQSSRRHGSTSVPCQRKRECLECLVLLSTILAWECECLHSCVLCLVHILPKVWASTRDENVNRALQLQSPHTHLFAKTLHCGVTLRLYQQCHFLLSLFLWQTGNKVHVHFPPSPPPLKNHSLVLCSQLFSVYLASH